MTSSEMISLYIFGGAIFCFPLCLMCLARKTGVLTIGYIAAMLLMSFIPFVRELFLFVILGFQNIVIWKRKEEI